MLMGSRVRGRECYIDPILLTKDLTKLWRLESFIVTQHIVYCTSELNLNNYFRMKIFCGSDLRGMFASGGIYLFG